MKKKDKFQAAISFITRLIEGNKIEVKWIKFNSIEEHAEYLEKKFTSSAMANKIKI